METVHQRTVCDNRHVRFSESTFQNEICAVDWHAGIVCASKMNAHVCVSAWLFRAAWLASCRFV